jgi:hypothetical protein
MNFVALIIFGVGWDSIVSIVTRYRLDGLGIESGVGPRFSAPVQTGPGAHPAPCTMGTGSFQRVKQLKCQTSHRTPL